MFFIKILRNILNFLDDINQRKIIKLLSSKLNEKAIIFDVGAHFGETVLKFNKNLKIKKIYSFEASLLILKFYKKILVRLIHLNLKFTISL